MSFIALLVIGLVLALCVAFLRAYGLLLLIDIVVIATAKTKLEPDDDTPGLVRLTMPALIVTLGGATGLLSTQPLLWICCMLPAGLLAVPALKRFCRMSRATAARTAFIVVLIHVFLMLLLYHLGFRFVFDPHLEFH